MNSKFILIGQGLAGTILSIKLQEKGIDHVVIDDPGLSTSSRIAAGLINPIVLKRFKIVDKAEEFKEGLEQFYQKIEQLLLTKFYNPIPIHHIFHSIAEQNQWMEKSGKEVFEKYLGEVTENKYKSIYAPFGIGVMNNTAWIDTSNLILSYREKLKTEGKYFERKIYPSATEEIKDEFKADSLIFCNGHLMRSFKPDTDRYLAPTRGELLLIETDALPEEQIFHAGIFILPLGNKKFKIGATYHWDNLTDNTSEDARKVLERDLQIIFKGEYRIIEQMAGVRPNTIDRKPLLGKLDGSYIFNGLGSRGCLMAPKLADILINYILYQKEIPVEYNVERFG